MTDAGREREERTMLSKGEILAALRDVGRMPFPKHGPRQREVYETMNGDYGITYASFPGGNNGPVPRSIIDELEAEGLLRRAFPDAKHLNCWILSEVTR